MHTSVLKNDYLEIEYLTDALRIVGLIPAGKTNMLADLSRLPAISTSFGDFYFRGGHRLWHAPEAMPRTYIPDAPMTVTQLQDGALLEAQIEPGTGIRKQLEIHLSPDQPTVILTHILTNDGMWAVELAPWAITQFRLGGKVILPMPVDITDSARLLHNRQFSLWPYAHINDPRLALGDEFILFDAESLLPPFKIGYFHPNAWMGYWLDGILFRKVFEGQKQLTYPDNNCNAEMYCNDQFVELETLGPLTRLDPGISVSHVEKWEVLDKIDFLPEDLQRRLLSCWIH